MHKKVVFLGMGGTIAGKASRPGDNVGYKAAQLSVTDLLDAVPGLQVALGSHTAVAEQVAQLDSKDMDHASWHTLANRVAHHLGQPDVAGVVITHGTDTLEETAYFLSCVLAADLLLAKPVVLTCAMRPATSRSPDGPQNMVDAVATACSTGARGVLVVCGGEVHDGRHVQKVHPYRVTAFDSGEAGPLGFVEEGVVRMVHHWPQVSAKLTNLATLPATTHWPRVEVLLSHAGATGALVRGLLAGPEHDAQPVRGIVVAGTGNGTMHSAMVDVLQLARSRGVTVVRCSRCAYGEIVESSSPDPADFPAMKLSPVKARIALMLDLMSKT